MSKALTASRTRIDALTGLRFFAALLVYLSHHPKPAYLADWLNTFFSAGYNGVTIFFVLSGFVIGFNYFESLSKPTRERIVRYGLARFARIYPLYFLVLIFVWWEQSSPPTGDLVIHLLAWQTWSSNLGLAYAFNGPSWSIGVEFFLYACFPLIVLGLAPLAQNKRALWAIALLVILAMVAVAVYFDGSGRGALPWAEPESAHRWLYRMPATRLGDFVLGVIAALLFKYQGAISQRARRIWAISSYAASGSIVALMLWRANLYSAFSWDVAYAPSTFILLQSLALSPQTSLARFLGSRVVVLLGESSYAFYLIHTSLIKLSGINYYAQPDPVIALPMFAMLAISCVVLSIILHLYIETPMRDWINAFTQKSSFAGSWKDPAEKRRTRYFFQALGLAVLWLITFSVPRWLWEQAPSLNALEEGAVTHNRYALSPFQLQFVNGIQFVNYGLEERTPLQGGDKLRLLLKWSCRGGTAESYIMQIDLRDAKDRIWARGKGNHQNSIAPCRNSSRLFNDQTIASVAFSPPVTMPSGEYRIVLSLIDQTNQERIDAYSNSGEALGDQLQITSLTFAKNKASFTARELFLENPFFVDMQEMRLLGHAPLPSQIRPGDALDVGLYWRARSKPRGDYIVTVQLRDARGGIVVEQSARPAENSYPTTEWSAGEVLLDWHYLVLPQGILQGDYHLTVILRDAELSKSIGETRYLNISLVQ